MYYVIIYYYKKITLVMYNKWMINLMKDYLKK